MEETKMRTMKKLNIDVEISDHVAYYNVIAKDEKDTNNDYYTSGAIPIEEDELPSNLAKEVIDAVAEENKGVI